MAGTTPSNNAINITAVLGRALAVVKVTLQVNGNSQFLGVRPKKTTGAIKIKRGHVTILGNFGTPSISRQRLKLEILNLAHRSIARCLIVKK